MTHWPSTELMVRQARVEDAGAIVAIMNPIIAAGVYTVFDTPFTLEAEEAYLKNFPERGVFNVAVHPGDDGVLGFQSLEPFASYTRCFDHVGTLGTYVALDSRRRGVATALFAKTFELARRKGYEKLFTLVRADNPAALATYRRHGFSVVGRARHHAKINNRYVDELMIERFL